MTLEADVAERLQHEMRKTGQGMKRVVNDALRVGLGIAGPSAASAKPFRVEPHDFGVRPGIDLDRINQLVDELEVDEIARKLGQ